jgi:hypothetical protein
MVPVLAMALPYPPMYASELSTRSMPCPVSHPMWARGCAEKQGEFGASILVTANPGRSTPTQKARHLGGWSRSIRKSGRSSRPEFRTSPPTLSCSMNSAPRRNPDGKGRCRFPKLSAATGSWLVWTTGAPASSEGGVVAGAGRPWDRGHNIVKIVASRQSSDGRVKSGAHLHAIADAG